MQESEIDYTVVWQEYFLLIETGKRSHEMDLSKVDATQLSHLFALEARLMDDVANPPLIAIDAVYPMTHGEAYELALMNGAISRYVDIIRQYGEFPCGGEFPKVLYCDEDAASSFRGGAVWESYLGRSLLKRVLVPVRGAKYMQGDKPMINSFTEARPVLNYMRDNNLMNLEIVALPFHIQRCFVGFVTEILAMGLEVNVFARVTGHISWTESAVHSQGIQSGTATEFAEAEIEKVMSYKNLAAPSEVLRYLDERDARVDVLLGLRA